MGDRGRCSWSCRRLGFKQYILGILFYRFISEHMADYFDRAEHEASDLEFRYAELSDQEAEQDFKTRDS